MNYNDLTWHHFENPSHAGMLTGGRVRRGAAGSRAEGTWVQFEVRVGPAKPESTDRTLILQTVRFLAYACPHIIAAADFIAQEGTGRPARPVLPESVQALRRRFEIPVEKLGGLLIVEDAWIAAISSPDGA